MRIYNGVSLLHICARRPTQTKICLSFTFQVVRKSVKLHKMARHLVENCGLLSWCSSFFSMLTTKPTGDEDSRFVVVLEVCTVFLNNQPYLFVWFASRVLCVEYCTP